MYFRQIFLFLKILALKSFPYKICLSLNGAGEICNRDMEILASGSILFRPELNQKFHEELIPDYHYVTFDIHADANTQADIIIYKFNSIKVQS